MSERWKWVPGYEGRYKVSDLGRVKSYAKGAPVIMKQTPNSVSLYPTVSLYAIGGSRSRKQPCVHQLVMRAFVGPCPENKEIRHLNGDETDPRLDNLAYGRKLTNENDKHTHGTYKPPPIRRGWDHAYPVNTHNG